MRRIRLRLALSASRAKGVDFLVAWPLAVQYALTGLKGVDRQTWHRAISETRLSWYDSYDRADRPLALTSALAQF